MYDLRKLQLCQLDIALDIRDICERHGIPYFLIGGTLLGAVRHGGFIPWDDDLDIGFLRKDYEHFIKVCKDDLPDRLFLQTWDTDENYGFPFGKVMLRGTVFRQTVFGETKAHDMIFVDIFPYDNLAVNLLRRKYQFILVAVMGKLLLYKQGYDIGKESDHKLLHKVLKSSSHLFSKDILKRIIQYAQTMSNVEKTEKVISFYDAVCDREWMDIAGASIEKMIFEGYEFNVPVGWDQLLKNTYGDYMQLPPESERNGKHTATIVDMGKYQIRNNAAY